MGIDSPASARRTPNGNFCGHRHLLGEDWWTLLGLLSRESDLEGGVSSQPSSLPLQHSEDRSYSGILSTLREDADAPAQVHGQNFHRTSLIQSTDVTAEGGVLNDDASLLEESGHSWNHSLNGAWGRWRRNRRYRAALCFESLSWLVPVVVVGFVALGVVLWVALHVS